MSESKSKIALSIIIVSYNNPDLLRKTVEGIEEHITNTFYEIIIIDNASTEENVKMIRENFTNVLLIENDTNRGFASACNIGAKAASGRYLLFVNSDIILSGNPVRAMLEIFEKYEDTAIVGCQLLNSDGTLQRSYYELPSLSKRIVELLGIKKLLLPVYHKKVKDNTENFKVKIIKGAFFMIPKQIFFNLSGFDEDYFMYMEDVDLSYRALKTGKVNWLVNTRNVVHLGWHVATLENPTAFIHGNKGLIIFYNKNYNQLYYFILVVFSILIFSIRLSFMKLFFTKTESIKVMREGLNLYFRALLKPSSIYQKKKLINNAS